MDAVRIQNYLSFHMFKLLLNGKLEKFKKFGSVEKRANYVKKDLRYGVFFIVFTYVNVGKVSYLKVRVRVIT